LRAPNGERKRQTGIGSGVQNQVRHRQKNPGQIFAPLERKKDTTAAQRAAVVFPTYFQ
jgi:hypothetical protein